MNLTIEQRDRLLAILPKYERKSTGRPRADLVKVLEGILYVLTTGCRWEDIDKYKYASTGKTLFFLHQTCHRLFSGMGEGWDIPKSLTYSCERVRKC